MSPLQAQLDRVRRRQWLVIAIMVVAMAGAVAFSLIAGTSYTGRAALSVTSDRTPEQDASLARGYVEYFNQDFAQDTLRERTGLPSTVSFEARNSATSPIMYIEATASEVEQATEAARALATAFREEINRGVAQQTEQQIADLRAELDTARARLAEVPANGQQSSLLSNEIGNIQSRIQQIQTDTFNNQLKELSLNAGVTSKSSNVVQNAVLGLVGGFILGVVAALVLASAEDRLVSPQQVRERLGLDTLARIKRGGGEEQREQQLKSLANVVSLSDMSRPAILAVTSVRSAELSAEVAESLAFYRAQQGERTLLIRADLESARSRGAHTGRPGLGDFLAGGPGVRLQPFVLPSGLGRMLVLPAGSSRDDPYALFGPERFHDAIQQASHLADLIVIDAPAIVDAAEAQVICASADRTILVVAEGTTRASDAVEARERLDRVHAQILGAVIGQVGAERTESSAARRAASALPAGAPGNSSSNGVYDEMDVRA
ncbi:hypothetical protein HF519_05995 [Pseudonocardia bannensis]|uniref:Uncharacterized protein n=1 Tax=Pseudonocardia bannensis TaxID=630973 RepID=A0A848DEV3_9PSEU|nr:CpsD/CapB family tyrosine-protein kinase [Pseudonocardia bannensis]NMH91152.1 hypothetical protein [Pseudonocardia bannensis]